jgi:hypothetical protein
MARILAASAVLGALVAAVLMMAPASGASNGQVAAGDTASPEAAGAGGPAPQDRVSATSLSTVAPARLGRLLQAVEACPAEARACVDTGLRLSWIQRGGRIVYGPVRIMPGTPSLPGATATPHGVFHVRWKDADHVSSEFDEPMPNSVFFAPGGVALHAGPLNAGSHGCVHLSRAASRFYYTHLPVGAEVAVFG